MENAPQIPEKELADKIIAHCATVGLSPTKFGVQALKDPNLVRDLLAGRELRRKTRHKIQSILGDECAHGHE